MMMGIGFTFPFITYSCMCEMDISELNEWFVEAKEHQQRLKDAQDG